jgi:flagellar hook-associated protein 1 FlgK
MGLLNSALQIGRSALLSYQGALEVVGNNISSSASPDYTRLSPQLDPLQGNGLTRGLQPGAGVALTDIQRHLDEALESRVRLAVSGDQAAAVQQATLAQVEALFDETSGVGLSSKLRAFLHGFDDVQNSPEDLALRELAISNGAQLAEALRTLRSRLIDLGAAADEQIEDLVNQANSLITQLADLNERISRAEAGGRARATGLRDQRDGVLRRLSEIVNITTIEQTNGAMNVYIGSETVVQGNFSRGLTVVTETLDGFTRTSVRFADTRSQVAIDGGRLAGLIAARDEHAYARVADVDRFAAAIITEVNRIHAEGQGLAGLRAVTGSVDLLATDVPLNQPAAGLDTAPRSGSFFIVVTDGGTGTDTAYRIDINLDEEPPTTLESLVADINAQVEGVTASITSDRRLSLTADEGLSFTFGHDGQAARSDTSLVLTALGVNTFFTGTDATDIAVRPELQSNPALLAAARTHHPGDGTNAGRLAALDAAESNVLDGTSIADFHHSMAGAVAVSTAAGRDRVDAASVILSSLRSQKESVSGVSLDEEAVSLLKFERAFQGATRFVTVVDELIGELVALIR